MWIFLENLIIMSGMKALYTTEECIDCLTRVRHVNIGSCVVIFDRNIFYKQDVTYVSQSLIYDYININKKVNMCQELLQNFDLIACKY